MGEGSPVADNTWKAEVLFYSPISLSRQNFFARQVVWEGEEQPAVGEQECKGYFSK